MKRRMATLGLGLMIGAVSCSTSGKKISYRNFELSIVRGVTTESEVVQLIGSPNFVSKNSRDDDIWTYSKRRYNPATGRVEKGTVLSGGNKVSSNGRNSAIFDLIITFDNDQIVKNYTVISSD